MSTTFPRMIAATLALAPALLSFHSLAVGADETRAKPMRIGVIGAGSLGGTAGSVLVRAGLEVKFSSRHPNELVAMARGLGARASVGTPREAAQLVRDAGCEPVIVGNLASGRKFDRGSPGFRANTTAAKLRQLLGLPQ